MDTLRTLSRRRLLKTGPLAAALSWGTALAGSPPARSHPGGEEKKEENKKAASSILNTQVSLAAYSMRQALSQGSMDLFGFIDWCAEMKLAGTELTSYYFREGFDHRYLLDLRRRAYRQGVTISGTAVRNNFCLPPGPQKDKEIQHVHQWIDHAAVLFAPHIRIFAGNVPEGVSRGTAIEWVAEGILQVLDHAAERGITIGLENHGGITSRAEDHLAICDAVGPHPWFGINVDTGNFRTNPYQELAMIAPRAVNVQIKAEIRDDQGKEVPADFERIRQILAEAGYQGWVVLEYEAEADPMTEIPGLIARLKELFEGVRE